VSRRLQQASSLLTLAATKGYTQAMGEAMRDRFRHLRHDLRNPLGTIKSVLAMMDDETMPAEARAHPRFRAMAKRNARSLGELIADRLSDAEAIVPALAQQSASLRTIACGVRRDLRAKAAARGATVTVGGARSRVTVDAAGLELVLHELLSAALNEAAAGDELSVEFGEMRDEHVPVTVLCAPARRLITTDVLERLAGLTARMGATLEAGDQAVVVLVPVRRTEITIRASEVAASVPMTADVDGAPPAAESISGSRDPGYDVRGSGEREYGQSGRL
jgi:signal transduction histidine kinase